MANVGCRGRGDWIRTSDLRGFRLHVGAGFDLDYIKGSIVEVEKNIHPDPGPYNVELNGGAAMTCHRVKGK